MYKRSVKTTVPMFHMDYRRNEYRRKIDAHVKFIQFPTKRVQNKGDTYNISRDTAFLKEGIMRNCLQTAKNVLMYVKKIYEKLFSVIIVFRISISLLLVVRSAFFNTFRYPFGPLLKNFFRNSSSRIAL